MRNDRSDPAGTMTLTTTSRLQLTLSIAAVLAAALLLTIASLRCIWNSDFWWQYATGRLIADSGIPQSDVFSHTKAGAEWIELRWIFCLGLYYLYEACGAAGVILAQCMVMLASFAILTSIFLKRENLPAAALVLTLAVLAASQRFQSRPEQVTYLLIAVFLYVIQRARDGRTAWAWILPPLQIVWTNAHTLFILGPFLVGFWLMSELFDRFRSPRGSEAAESHATGRWRIAALVFALTFAACLLNPYGLRGLAFPFLLATEIHGTAFKEHISEFAGTFSFSQKFTAVIFYEVLLTLCIVSTLINLRRLDGFWLMVCISLGYLAVIAIRNLPLFCLVAVPFVIQNVSRSQIWHRRGVCQTLPVISILTSALVIVICLGASWSMATDRFSVWQKDTNEFGLRMATNRYPHRAVEFLRAAAPAGPIFNTMMEGSYLLAHGFPVFIDPRLEVYGEEFFTEYMQMLMDEQAWQRGLEKYGIRVAVVDLISKAVTFLRDDPAWQLVFFDSVAAVFVRADTAGDLPVVGRDVSFESLLAPVRQDLPAPVGWSDTPWWRRVASPSHAHRVGMFLFTFRQYALAESVMSDGLLIHPEDAALHKARGATLEWLGRPSDATAAYEQAVRLDPSDSAVWGLLGRCYFAAGELSKARPALERSTQEVKNDARLWAMLSRIYISERDLERALASAQQSVRCAPDSVMYRKDLAKIHAARREVEPMLAAFREAARLAPQDCTVWTDLLQLLIELKLTDRARALLDQVPPACATDAKLLELRGRLTGGT